MLAPRRTPLAVNTEPGKFQFRIMVIVILRVGVITPAPGLNLFVVSGMTGKLILRIAALAVPCVPSMFIVALLILHVPAVSTTLLPDTHK